MAIYSKEANGSDVHVQFVDWIPLICNILGMLMSLPLPAPQTRTSYGYGRWRMLTLGRINSIDKSRLSADSYSYSGNGVAWKARVILFVGFAFMAGGLAGSVTVLVLKYLIHHYPFPTLGFGVSNVVANALVMLRCLAPILRCVVLTFFSLGLSAFGADRVVRLCCGLRRILRRTSISIIYRFEGFEGTSSTTAGCNGWYWRNISIRHFQT